MVAMHFKRIFARARPSRLDPALLPPIEVPGHASYPSAHAGEAMLIALVLEQVLPPEIIQDANGAGAAEAGPLRTMARRTGRNHEVLGVHYPSDTLCGFRMAARMLPLFLACPTVRGAAAAGVAGALQAQAAVGLEAAASEAVRFGSEPYYNDGLLAKARQEWS
jgi:hypothetical protein